MGGSGIVFPWYDFILLGSQLVHPNMYFARSWRTYIYIYIYVYIYVCMYILQVYFVYYYALRWDTWGDDEHRLVGGFIPVQPLYAVTVTNRFCCVLHNMATLTPNSTIILWAYFINLAIWTDLPTLRFPSECRVYLDGRERKGRPVYRWVSYIYPK